ncbi:MAG: hypothetical protein GY790_06040 [Bacteroidetes bacterium]|nr:hypothetical protein [Bacteroidota bacterium]
MSEKLLKILIYVAGAVCLFAFVAIRSLPVMNSVLVEKMIPEHWEFSKYGELYYFNYISEFKEVLPEPVRKYRFCEKHPAMEQADILMFGDSFLDISRQYTLPERLSDSLNTRVFFHRFLAPQESNPFCPLPEAFENSETKILIYETVERNIPMKFDEAYGDADCISGETGRMEAILEKVFYQKNEEMYKQLLKRSVFTSGIFAVNAGAKFNMFGYVSSQTPRYKTGDQPWLFHHRQVNGEPGSFYYHHSDEEIGRYCDHIALLQKEVKERLNMDMIFLPVPNKYTIYSHLVCSDPYDNFLPRLCKGLEERNVTFVSLYDDYISAEEILYYGTDTHWNIRGVDIALENLVETINSIKN